MSYPVIFGIALALAMDAFAVSISYGCSPVKMSLRNMFTIALFFGAFQALMPFAGWFSGQLFEQLISAWDHWIAFTLLAIIGIKMIIEGVKDYGAGESCEIQKDLGYKKLFILSVATSIDALAVGLSLSVINYPIAIPAAIIGAVTFVISLTGVRMGCRLQHILGRRVEILGGAILVFIGLKILFEHIG
ncbi:MAG: manganese efflux pump [Spirochaetes bacterium]|nr:manganese efflux pump [Spirochaetota bacterium]